MGEQDLTDTQIAEIIGASSAGPGQLAAILVERALRQIDRT